MEEHEKLYYETKNKYLAYLFYFTYLILPSITSTIFHMFVCTEVDSKNYLVADIGINCQSTYWRDGIIYASIMIIIYPLGIPMMYLWLLYQVKDRIIEINNDSPVDSNNNNNNNNDNHNSNNINSNNNNNDNNNDSNDNNNNNDCDKVNDCNNKNNNININNNNDCDNGTSSNIDDNTSIKLDDTDDHLPYEIDEDVKGNLSNISINPENIIIDGNDDSCITNDESNRSTIIQQLSLRNASSSTSSRKTSHIQLSSSFHQFDSSQLDTSTTNDQYSNRSGKDRSCSGSSKNSSSSSSSRSSSSSGTSHNLYRLEKQAFFEVKSIWFLWQPYKGQYW